MENKKRNNRTSLLLVAITMLIASCTKPEHYNLPGLKDRAARQRVQTLQSQTRREQTSGRQTSPIDMQGAVIMTPLELAVKADTSGVDSSLIKRIFQDVLSQGEKLWGRYFLDGQYAYANNLRRYIEQKHHVVCQKLFVYGNLTAVSPRYGCVSSWQYDVACAIRGKGDVLYILDPRLFASVVSRNIWVESHLNPTVRVPQPRLTSQALVAGESFTPLDNIPSGYLVDADYRYTDIMLGYYADSVGCNNTILQ